MNRNLKVILFVLILGVVTSLLLLGAKALTEDRIAINADVKLKSAVLDGFDIAYTIANIHDVFDTEVAVYDYEGSADDNSDNLTFYYQVSTGAIAFEFSGGGVWDTISGILTLESDFETIQKIAVLEQAETPGLGGVVATSQYLDTFVGVVMVPQLEINKDDAANAVNEVDTITGATRTSKAFETMLNETYTYALSIWEDDDLDVEGWLTS